MIYFALILYYTSKNSGTLKTNYLNLTDYNPVNIFSYRVSLNDFLLPFDVTTSRQIVTQLETYINGKVFLEDYH